MMIEQARGDTTEGLRAQLTKQQAELLEARAEIEALKGAVP